MQPICFQENDLDQMCHNNNFSTNSSNLESSQNQSCSESLYQNIKDNKLEMQENTLKKEEAFNFIVILFCTFTC